MIKKGSELVIKPSLKHLLANFAATSQLQNISVSAFYSSLYQLAILDFVCVRSYVCLNSPSVRLKPWLLKRSIAKILIR